MEIVRIQINNKIDVHNAWCILPMLAEAPPATAVEGAVLLEAVVELPVVALDKHLAAYLVPFTAFVWLTPCCMT